ncbi:MAG: tripartite tricarboxylate transporter substrate binding protein [Betaproteobacteria bacterium]|nr:tripartite tricarboxylate transporter substrate binding protein [Betaproteobacteria bacterium]
MNFKLALAMLCAMTAAPAWTQQYPAKPIRFVIPFPPGGSTDLLGRLIGQQLTQQMGQQVVIDNRGGAGGTIGVENAARSAPDGYTLVLGHIGTFGVAPSLYSKLPYDPIGDFVPIGLFGGVSNLLVVHPSLPARSVKALIALARARPGQLNYGSAGVGSASHLQMEYFKLLTKTGITHVPYKGTGPMVTELVAGQTQVTSTGVPGLLGQVKAGRLRPLAVASAKRLALVPEVPTSAEAGLPGFVVSTWYGPLAPAKTPAEIITRLNSELQKMLQKREVLDRLASSGVEPLGGTPQQYAAHIRSEMDRWAKVVKAAGIKPQ